MERASALSFPFQFLSSANARLAKIQFLFSKQKMEARLVAAKKFGQRNLEMQVMTDGRSKVEHSTHTAEAFGCCLSIKKCITFSRNLRI
jgi:hypothetical protein